jgi:hypothetical protein
VQALIVGLGLTGIIILRGLKAERVLTGKINQVLKEALAPVLIVEAAVDKQELLDQSQAKYLSAALK